MAFNNAVVAQLVEHISRRRRTLAGSRQKPLMAGHGKDKVIGSIQICFRFTFFIVHILIDIILVVLKTLLKEFNNIMMV